MRAITLWQPWASLVAVGAKQWETRSWGTTYRGPLLIHAALRKPPAIDNPFVIEEMIQALGVADFDELPRGVVLAFVDLSAVHQLTHERPPMCGSCLKRERLLGDFTAGRYIWRLQGGFRLTTPVAATGHQGLWRPHPVTLAVLEAQLRCEP